VILLVIAWAGNKLIARFFGAITNLESAFITALILALILPPVAFTNVSGSIGLALIALIAVASKYVIALGKKHIFNPVALAVVISAFAFNLPASWWAAGNLALLPFVVIGGLLIIYKLRRFDLFFAFLVASLFTVALTSSNPLAGVQAAFLHSALFFLAFAMLTEPLTMPPTRSLRIIYGAIVGIFFAPAVHLGSFYFTPELALLAGNLFSYLVSPKGRFTLSFVSKNWLSEDIDEFIFKPDRPIHFKPGQYLEWTLRDVPIDMRGNRRYFTISSAPEEKIISLGVRFYEKPSAFKRVLQNMKEGDTISVTSLAGDFTLPKDTKRKLAFIAGGVGITPFASMARHMIAAGESRDAVLLYSNRSADEIAYQDVFARAARQGLRTVYVLTAEGRGRIDAELIKKEIQDYRERIFYISGPHTLVSAMKHTLLNLGVSRRKIKTDYFPGLV